MDGDARSNRARGSVEFKIVSIYLGISGQWTAPAGYVVKDMQPVPGFNGYFAILLQKIETTAGPFR